MKHQQQKHSELENIEFEGSTWGKLDVLTLMNVIGLPAIVISSFGPTTFEIVKVVLHIIL